MVENKETDNLNLLKYLDTLAKYGVYISYNVVNQIKNGRHKDVESGLIPLITYTVYVDVEDDEEIYSESFDTIEEAITNGIQVAEEYIKENDL